MPDPTNPIAAPDASALAAQALDAAIAGEAMPDIPEPVAAPAAAADPADPTAAAPAATDEIGLPVTPTDPAAPDPNKPDPATVPGTPEFVAAEKAKTDAAAAADTPEAKAEAERKAAVDKEADALNLKAAARAKFHEAADYKKATAPIVAELEKVGVKTAADVVKLVDSSKTGEELFERVRVTGVSPDQYLNLLDYGAVNVKSEAGDAKAGDACIQFLASELVRVCQLHGRDLPAIGDPLAAHKDLLEAVEDGKHTRESALEVARARSTQARVAATTDAQRQQAEAAAQKTQAVEAGRTALRTVSAELYGTTPATQAAYKRIEAQLIAAIPRISAEFPPAQWGAALRTTATALLAALPAAPAAKPVAPVGRIGPSRSSGPTPPLVGEHATPEQALDAALAFEAAQGG